MEAKLLTFEEFLNESEEERLDEGWREVVIAGAMALAAIRGAAQTPGSVELLKEPQRQEYVQKEEKKVETVTVNFGNEFSSGTYKFNKENQEGIEKKLGEIGKFIKDHQNADITIHIQAGESQVTNKDAETGKSLPKGALAQKRAEVTKDVVETFLNTLKEKGILNGRYVIDTTTEIGKTPYKPGENVNQEKFTKEQFVKVTLEVKNTIDIKTTDFSAFAKIGERMYRESNHHAFGDIFYIVRSTNKIEDAGNKDTGHEDVLLKTLAKESDFARTKNPYDGRTFLIPWEWLNKAGNYNVFSDKNIDYILTHFEVK